MSRLVFVHLSDIHFDRRRSAALDLDSELRSRLESDCAEMAERLGSPVGILVTGDVAYCGAKDEYERAEEWLQKVSRVTGVHIESVFVTPGNHDVDRSKVAESRVIRDMHERLRGCPKEEVDELLREYLEDRDFPDMLYRPIAEYNNFAAKLGCALRPPPSPMYWEEDFPLNDGSILRLRGLNSTLISDRDDDEGAGRLILGSFPLSFENEGGVEYMTLCHHPPQWLRDDDNVESRLKAGVRIQLFGHKHKQVLDQINETVRLTAGAVHPARQETQWEPRYNWITVSVECPSEARLLVVEVHPRIWHGEERRFAPASSSAGADRKEFRLKLSPFTRIEDARPPVSSEADSRELGGEHARVPVAMNASRRLTYQFLSLPYQVRVQIAQELGLLEDEDRDASDLELVQRFFQRARQRKLLARLWEEVEGRYGSTEREANPFEGQ